MQHGAVVLRQLGGQPVAASLQVYDGRRCRRQPEVLHLDDRQSVDGEVVSAGHLLAHVQQEGIVARLLDVERGCEDVALAHLALAALGGRDVDGLGG